MTRPVSIPFARLGLRAFAALTLVGLLSMLLGPAIVRADTVVNSVDNNVNSVTIPAGGSVNVSYWVAVQGAGLDGQGGCNAADGTPAVVTVRVPAGVTASKSQLTFHGCGEGNLQVVTFSSATANTYIIPDVDVSDACTGSGCGSYSAAATDFTLQVTAPADTTKPTISLTSPVHNDAYVVGTAVYANYSCADEAGGSGLASCVGTVASGAAIDTSTIGGPYTFTVNAADTAGNTQTASVNYTVVAPPDTTSPDVRCTIPNQALWYGSDQTVDCTASDSGSGLANPADASFSLSTSVTAGTETNVAQTGSRTVYDNVGNSTTVGPFGFAIDKKAPGVSCGAADGFWHAANVSIACTASDGGSGLATAASFNLSTTIAAGSETNNAATNSSTVTDKVGNSATAGPISGNQVDRKAPSLTASATTADGTYTAGTWTKQAVTVSFACVDDGSGSAGNPANQVFPTEGEHSVSGVTCEDNVANVSAPVGFGPIKIDQTAPTLSINGGITDGDTYYAGYNVPAAPTCSAADSLSGLTAPCSITGYSTALGTHTVTAKATDNAGNETTKSITYTVGSLTFSGFVSPVDMGITNTLKGGNAVPLKFRVFAGNTEVTDASLFRVKVITVDCKQVSTIIDEVEVVTTGATSLRYENGQFITNWKTPTGVGCYKVVVTLADGTTVISQVAYFQTRK